MSTIQNQPFYQEVRELLKERDCHNIMSSSYLSNYGQRFWIERVDAYQGEGSGEKHSKIRNGLENMARKWESEWAIVRRASGVCQRTTCMAVAVASESKYEVNTAIQREGAEIFLFSNMAGNSETGDSETKASNAERDLGEGVFHRLCTRDLKIAGILRVRGAEGEN